jgi:uncharacterized integral membrane protein
MKFINLLVLAALLALFVFAALNWAALTAATVLSFGFFRVEAPLGVILLGFALVFALLLFGYAAVQRAAMLLEARRHAQELKALRELADSAEASRVAELRRQLEDSTNTLAAHIGQIDDKLNRLKRE